MSSLATRIGRNLLRFNKHGIRDDMKKNNSVIFPVGGMFNDVTQITAHSLSLWTKLFGEKQYGDTDHRFVYYGKGKIKNGADGVKIEVGEEGTTVKFQTDYKGKTLLYAETIEDYTNDRYKFYTAKNINPVVQYKTIKNESVIRFSLSKI